MLLNNVGAGDSAPVDGINGCYMHIFCNLPSLMLMMILVLCSTVVTKQH